MKNTSLVFIVCGIALFACTPKTKESTDTIKVVPLSETKSKHLFLDVHNLEPGKVTFSAVADAHQKDLATQNKYGVSFLKYWVDEVAGKIYCLAESFDSASIFNTHKEAHGLVPDLIHQVNDGEEGQEHANATLFFDIHRLGAGKVTEEAVAEAHKKDLAVQNKYNVNLINYWIDEKEGVVMCLAESKDELSLIKTHKEAHGLLPDEIHKVKQGQ